MTARISRAVRCRLGWCPHAGAMPARRELLPSAALASAGPADNRVLARHDAIVDYRSTGASMWHLIGFVAAVTGMVLLLSSVRTLGSPFLSGLLLLVLVLVATAAVHYENRQAHVEITGDSLVLRDVLPWAVVIPRNRVTGIEVRDNIPPVPRWLLTAMTMIAIPLVSAGILYGKSLDPVAGGIVSLSFLVRPGIAACAILFFLAIWYHSLVRSRYPSVLLITTDTKKLIGIYSDDPNGITSTLGLSS
jgi:hypothetical protein